ncbi:MAG: hypothetical protein JXO22_13085 [Phycisphaerae bacterium]|nr:hypothetical protein [Phycisphaerae bacterium]
MSDITVYPRRGKTYPDAAGVPITSAGAIVDSSKYITDAVNRGYLLTEDPLGIFQPDDRTTPGGGSGGGSMNAFATAALLGGSLGTVDGSVSVTTGCLASGDGGGGDWYWASGDSTTENVGTVVGASVVGRWKRLYSGPLNARWFGATGNGTTDDSVALQAWLNAIPLGGEGFLPLGTYRVTQPLIMNTRDCKVSGEGSGIHSAVGTKIVWDGADATKFVLTMPWYGQEVSNVHFELTASCRGFIEMGSIGGSLSSRCRLKNVAMLGDPLPGRPTFTYGAAIGYTNPGAFNMEYMHFEEVYVANALDSAFYVGGTANCLGHTWVRCIVNSGMGFPGQRAYVAAGLSDGVPHPYGRGIHLVGGNQISCHQCNFGYLESWCTWTTADRDFITFHEMDSEHCKKAVSGSFSNFGHVVISGTRAVVDKIEISSLGPVGYLAANQEYVDINGTVGTVEISSCSMTRSDSFSAEYNRYISAPIIVAKSSTFAGREPFADPGNECKVFSQGNRGSNGAGQATPVLSGNYKLHAGGYFAEPTHFDAIQTMAPDAHPWNYFSTTGEPFDISVTRRNTMGKASIVDAATSVAVAFSIAELDFNYVVRITPVQTSGTPATGSLQGIAINKTTAGFDISVPTAPGVGSSVTYVWEIVTGYGL